jgi:predicted  nucleic acid-binding Zn-ribbon protein
MSDDPILAALARLEAGLARVEIEQEVTIRAAFTDIRADLRNFRTDLVDELAKTRGAIMARVDRVQETVQAMRDDIAVNFGAVDQVKRAHDNTREEVRILSDIVSTLVRKVRTLEDDMRTLKGDP